MANEAGFSAQLRQDLSNLYGSSIFVQLIPNMRMTGKKPFDFWLLKEHHFIAVECKFVKKGEHRFDYKRDIRPHQPECLQKIIEAGGGGCFCVGFNDQKTAFIFTSEVLEMLIEKAKSDTTVTYEEILEFANKHPERIAVMERKKVNGVTRWEVEKFLSC